jgi:hypothetical protein
VQRYLSYPKAVKLHAIFAALGIAGVCALSLPAYELNYLPLGNDELSLRFPLRMIADRFGPAMEEDALGPIGIGSTTVSFVPPNIVRFSGTDRAGRAWTVEACAGQSGTLYTADLDSNGTTDIVFASYTGGNGWAPSMHLLTLLFEKAGRPVPLEMDGYFAADARGIQDILDLDRDGRAEIVRQSFDDGYWITSLYEAQDARWHLVKGPHAARRFPLFTRFTSRANRVPVTPAAGRHPIEDDLSNDTATAPTRRLERLDWADVRRSGLPKFRFSDGGECLAAGWYSTMAVVIDTPERRIAATLGSPELAKQLLDKIAKERISVLTAGNRRSSSAEATGCSVELIWGASPRSATPR